jgi:hypothetical protein
VDDRLPDITAPDEVPPVLGTKFGVRRRRVADRGFCGVAVVQNNDAVVTQVTQGVLDVTQSLPVSVEPVD